ncbi:hypothetical protein BDV95DRAFT_503948 [Massariosphaeria phaeospora]|uniref:HTH APSES-type domain-containing protein n=1 Tax=Massariosphaeria phaeospora TaxID=100035 RepID=A0A7C8MH65_9PLEO|nr:hypothetical protein BDV95DRAFT_503948 [Massariosphaeria phaeospora]
MKIQSLLNPFCGDHHGYRSSESPTPATQPRSVVPIASAPKRQKIPKDAAIFTEGNKIVGPVNYPPYEAGDDEDLAAQHRMFQVYPMSKGDIYSKGVRHIPYNSEKKDFMVKTGREAFEVFQYAFKIPGEDKEYVVLWDYNVGLVRITPFFKSCKYSKTTPAKVLNQNQGLRDISYSITGGALVGQGYWMPYNAAKAVAATFCYNIRWALTPVFGKEFLTQCTHPKDPNFAKFLIDPSIVLACTIDTNRWREEGSAWRPTPSETTSIVGTPKMQFACPPWGMKVMKQQRLAKPVDLESGYGTDTDQSDRYLFSPQVSPRSVTWTSVNRSQSPASPPTFHSPAFSPPVRAIPPPPNPWLTSVPSGCTEEQLRTKRTHSKVAVGNGNVDVDICRPTTASSVIEPGYSESAISGNCVQPMDQVDAAQVLLQISNGGESLPPPKRTRRGSKY